MVNLSGVPPAVGSATSWPSRFDGSMTAALHALGTASLPRYAQGLCYIMQTVLHLQLRVLSKLCCTAHILRRQTQP